MATESDEGQLGLWMKLNRLYGKNGSDEGEMDESAGSEQSEANSGRETDSQSRVQSPAGYHGLPGKVDSVNENCLGCEMSCKQPAGKFVEILCPISPAQRAHKNEKQQEVASRQVYELDKVNPSCSKCRRGCKQTTEKLNIMLCPGFEPLESTQADSP